MLQVWQRRIIGAAALGVAAAAVIWFGRSQPIPVDLATVARGAMQVTVEDEGKTRVRHVYTVSAPVAGKVLRISRSAGDPSVSRHVGDAVTAGETVVAVMQPLSPSLLDVRSRADLQAAVAAAEAAVTLAEAEVRSLEATLEFSRDELRRAQALARTEVIAARTLDKARLDVETGAAAVQSAKAQLAVRRSERVSAAARLIDPINPAATVNAGCCIQLTSPVSGRVLKIIQDSEAVVPAGTPLIEIGDPLDLEVVADLLSTEAVQIEPGAAVRIDGWGGDPILGRVVRVDPAGFTKISALGIEEQRVRTTINFVDPPGAWSRLGHDYRVIVHVVIWETADALTVPVGALFRKDERWAVYTVTDGRARMTRVEVGRRNRRSAEIKSGLSGRDRVVLHPNDRIIDGTPVAERVTQ